MSRIAGWLLIVLIIAVSAGCQPQGPPVSTPAPSPTLTGLPPSRTPTVEPTQVPTSTVTPTRTPRPSPTTPVEPVGCLEPPEDYTLVHVEGYLLNARTEAMLQQAASLYQGEIDILGYAITQGSYTDQVSASFGTHAGGGAVDLSVMRFGTFEVLEDEIEPLIHALRVAGFAAWLRAVDDLYPGSPIHIHAIAIGDDHLSPAAEAQLTGEFGYFLGYDGLPREDRGPVLDRHGGPVICRWMQELGYTDLRPTPVSDVD